MYLGIDLGTSAVKVIVIDENSKLLASQSQSLTVSRPKPLWSEQDPQDWWDAVMTCMTELSKQIDTKQILAIGLSGQMHGAVTLDKNNQVLRPAILWNDGRSSQECEELEDLVKNSRDITGNLMMPGFTAPKLKWMQKYEADLFAQIHQVLLPKDYLRFKLSGEFASDMSDSAGTLWLDVEKRQWDNSILAACGLSVEQMPKLFEGTQTTGYLDDKLAAQWGMNSVPIIAGGGDNAAGAVGVGLTQPEQAMLSLGTSGVYFVVSDKFYANPESAVHSFCHALPNTWHLMSVVLSAASCLQWFSETILEGDIQALMSELESTQIDQAQAPIFLPYMSGERTPHNDTNATACFVGLTHSTTKLDMLYAVLEGVCFAFADGVEALHKDTNKPDDITLIGGGSRSIVWRQMFADILDTKISYREGGDVGPALGAARLALVACKPDSEITELCTQPSVVAQYEPNPAMSDLYNARRAKFKQLYPALKPTF